MPDKEGKTTKEVTQVTARLGDLHISPRKARLVADLIKRKPYLEAVKILSFLSKKAARPLLKLLNSAAANARNNFQLQPEAMRISQITVDTGRVMRRFAPRAQGRAFPIKKRTSVVKLVLSIDGKLSKPKKKSQSSKR